MDDFHKSSFVVFFFEYISLIFQIQKLLWYNLICQVTNLQLDIALGTSFTNYSKHGEQSICLVKHLSFVETLLSV